MDSASDPMERGDGTYVTSQRFRQPVIIGLTIMIALFAWVALFTQVIGGEAMGSRPAPDWMLVAIWLLFGILFPMALWKSRLTIRIDHDRFCYRYFPFHLKEHAYRIQQIESVESEKIRPVLHFGGWGIRYGIKGKGYIMSGKRAVRLNFRSGRPVYFTCNDPNEIVKIFDKRKLSAH
ncbi:MAG: hypothetical protein JJU46_08735 [Balneolaceae bacterium]|nr:hypothetical protein [Balneolaceae bacterium]